MGSFWSTALPFLQGCAMEPGGLIVELLCWLPRGDGEKLQSEILKKTRIQRPLAE